MGRSSSYDRYVPPSSISRCRSRSRSRSYDSSDEEMDTLPVNEYEDQIIENIRTHQVVIITGETGSGKSTQIPQLLYRNG